MTENTTESPTISHPLAVKITSEAQLDLILEANPDLYRVSLETVHSLSLEASPPEGVADYDNFELGTDNVEYWWLRRERLREKCGVYEPATEVLTHIRYHYGCMSMFPHVSTKVPGEIAYTPSRRDGREDRQVRTTLGKFLAKYCPLLTDKAIANIDAAHKAELDSSFLVATTAEEIEHVYTTMLGDTGCMRYGKAHFNQNVHPSAVYAYEGLKVAYLTNSDGDVNARAVIYDNPNDPTDKRYVRVYGARVLTKKLERSGYKCDGLGNARLKLIKGKETGTIIMPYLDPAGGIHAQIRSPNNAGYVVWFEGDDFVTAVTDETVARLKAFGISVTQARSQHGRIAITPTKRASLTCALSGKAIDVTKAEPAYILRSRGGQIELASEDEVDKSVYAYQGHGVTRDSGGCAQGRTVFASDPSCIVSGYAATQTTFEHYSFLIPHEMYVGVDTIVGSGGEWVQLEGSFVLPTAAKRKDAVVYFDENGTKRTILLSEKPEGAVAVMTDASQLKSWSHKSNARLVRTIGGRWAIPGYSPVFPYTSGGYCASSTGTPGEMFGIKFRKAEGFDENPALEQPFIDAMAALVEEHLANYGEYGDTDWAARLVRLARTSLLSTAAPYPGSYGGIRSYDSYYDAYDGETVVRTHHTIKKHLEAGAKISANPGQHMAWKAWFHVIDKLLPGIKQAIGFGESKQRRLESIRVNIDPALLPAELVAREQAPAAPPMPLEVAQAVQEIQARVSDQLTIPLGLDHADSQVYVSAA